MSSDLVVQALTEKTGFELVRKSDTPKYLRLIGRVQQVRMPDLLSMFDNMLKAEGRTDWGVDVSKVYFRPKGAARTVFAWRFIFETTQEVLNYESIVLTIRSSPQVSGLVGGGPLAEIKLAGESPLRNNPRNGKGADLFGRAVVGPMAGRR